MILFEANAVAPLVKLPDGAVEERVQREMVALIMASARRKAPPLQNRKGRPPNFKSGENQTARWKKEFKGKCLG
jgi:hypothetical protein